MQPPADSDERGVKSASASRLLIVAAAVMWSTSGLFAKMHVFDDWPLEHRGLLLAFWRPLFASLLLIPCVRRPRWNVRLLPMTFCFSAMNVTFVVALTWTTAANAIWLQSTAPLWICVLSLLLGMKVRRLDIVPLAFGAMGIGVILFYELLAPASESAAATATSQWGVVLGLVAGIGYAGVIMFGRALREENPVWLVALNHLVAAAVLAPVALTLTVSHGYWPNLQQLAVLAGFGLLQMGIPYVLFLRALQRTPSQEASLIGLLEPVLVPVWVAIIIDETRWWSLAGGGLILLGLLIRYTLLIRYALAHSSHVKTRDGLAADSQKPEK